MVSHDTGASSSGDNDTSKPFERQLSENYVEYYLVHAGDFSSLECQVLRLSEAQQAAQHLVESLTRDYIWQRDDFRLKLTEEDGLHFLYGITDYGDSLEDEWLIVYMLRELTKSQPELWARVVDSEEEFLLSEAAHVLPAWLSPEMDKNRVWIHDGNLFIIPPEAQGGLGSSDQPLTLNQAVDFIRRGSGGLFKSRVVQSEAFFRLEKYPAQVTESAHRALATIPRKLAHVLHHLPQSISPAVESFYLRDALSLKPVMSVSGFLHFPPRDFVTISVRFSRVLFAQIKSQYFEPPPRWQQLFAQALSAKPADENTKMAKIELGMKLTCGFEMLASRTFEENRGHQRQSIVQHLSALLGTLSTAGDAALPTDKEIETWPDCQCDDDDSWMDINYEDFERELQGRPGGGAKSGFGNAQTQADLRKIVSRFEAFLNDNSAGLDGADIDDIDSDGEDDEEEDEVEVEDNGDTSHREEDSEDEDKAVNFDEKAFSDMMREMMGVRVADSAKGADDEGIQAKTQTTRDSIKTKEDAQIHQLATQMEAELKGYGALAYEGSLGDGSEKNIERLRGKRSTSTDDSMITSRNEGQDEEINIDYNLASNILKSFQSQAGMAGPASNLLGLMGIRLPRDEGDEDQENTKA